MKEIFVDDAKQLLSELNLDSVDPSTKKLIEQGVREVVSNQARVEREMAANLRSIDEEIIEELFAMGVKKAKEDGLVQLVPCMFASFEH